MKKYLYTALTGLLLHLTSTADVVLPNMYSDNAVIQRNVPVKIWGWADPAEPVTVKFVGLSMSTKADPQGNWSVTFPTQKAGGPYEMTVAGKNTLKRSNLLFGEVWLCSGQSNMQWSVAKSVDGDLEALLAKDTKLRIVTVSNAGSQIPQKDIEGRWSVATGEDLKQFSAVAYYFGRELRRALGVPVGLINNAWGASACEAWVPRNVLMSDKRNLPYLEKYAKKVADFESGKMQENYDKAYAKWLVNVKKAKAENKLLPRKPWKAGDPRPHQQRPANLWNARIYPLLNYQIKGAIWYQGETNTAGRSFNYRYLLPMMIKTWRQHWHAGNFPFYWAQLADYGSHRDKDGISPWAEMRESMTLTMKDISGTGQAVITDLGEDADIHPRRKLEVAKRLVRWALVKDYGFELIYSSPLYKSHEIVGNKVIITLDQEVKTFDVKEVLGFTIAGVDQRFVKAKAAIKKNKIEIWSDSISNPVAVRYAWAGNPDSNVINKVDLPVTPFRTDSWTLGSE